MRRGIVVRHRVGGEALRFAGAVLGEARRAEALRPGAANRQRLGRLPLEADLRREVVAEVGVVVEAAGGIDFQRFQERRIQLGVGAGHGALAEGMRHAEALGLQPRIQIRIALFLVAHVDAGGKAQRAAGQVHQGTRNVEVDRLQVGGRLLVQHRCQLGEQLRRVLRRIEEVVAAVVHHLDQLVVVEEAVVVDGKRVVVEHQRAVVVPLAHGAVDAADQPRVVVVLLRAALDATERIGDQRRLVERIVRIVRAVRQGRRQHERARIDRRARADLRRTAGDVGLVAVHAGTHVGLAGIAHLDGQAAVGAEAFLFRLQVGVLADEVLLATAAQVIGHRCRVRTAGPQRLPQRTVDRGAGQHAARSVRTEHGRPDHAVDRAGVEAGLAVRGVAAADPAEIGGVVRVAAITRPDAAVVLCLDAAIGIPAVLREIAAAEQQGGATRGAAAFLRGADVGRGLQPLEVVLENDVDDAGDRVGAVQRGGAVLQHIDALDRVHRDRVEVDEGTLAIIRQWVIGRAAAIDQHQGRVHRQAAQRDTGGTRGESGGKGRGNRTAVVRGNRSHHVVDGFQAAALDLGGGDHGDRRRRLQVDSRDRRAGHRDGLQLLHVLAGGRGRVLRGLRILRSGLGLRGVGGLCALREGGSYRGQGQARQRDDKRTFHGHNLHLRSNRESLGSIGQWRSRQLGCGEASFCNRRKATSGGKAFADAV